MSLPDFSNWIPLPAPVTSGSGIQSYTDPIGDVWVASNGVRGGNWYRARDVLAAKWSRNAAWTTVTGSVWTSVALDTVIYDAYGLWNAGPANGMTVPIPGLYMALWNFSCNPTAAAQYVQCCLNTGGFQAVTSLWAGAAGLMRIQSSDIFHLPAGGTCYFQYATSAALTGGASLSQTAGSLTYIGTG